MDAPLKPLSSQTANSFEPVERANRVAILDVLRGFALCGILLANILSFTGYFYLPEEQQASLPFASTDPIVAWFIHFFIEGKFYSIFSLLFGMGFALQLTRAGEKGAVFWRYFLRRLAILFLIGLAHLLLLWTGDILVAYALTGCVLLLWKDKSNKILLGWALVLLLLPVVQYGVVLALGGKLHPGTPFSIAGAVVSSYLRIDEAGGSQTLLEGGYRSMLKANATGAFYRFSDLLYSGRFFNILAMFLLGFYAGRQQLFRNPEAHRSLLWRLTVWGAGIGIPANLVLAWLMERGSDYPPSLLGLAQYVVYALGVAPLSLCYVALLALSWQGRPHLLAPLGRMALTNYLVQTLLCVLLFNGIGLRGDTGPTVALAIVVIILLLQMVYSKWWLRYFRFGPVEWLWRTLTYGKLQSMLHHTPNKTALVKNTLHPKSVDAEK